MTFRGFFLYTAAPRPVSLTSGYVSLNISNVAHFLTSNMGILAHILSCILPNWPMIIL